MGLIERRRNKRVEKPVSFRMHPGELREQRSGNISLGGLVMESNRFYHINQSFSLELIIPNETPIYCNARVAWIYPRTRSVSIHKVGLQFLDISPHDQERLKKFIYQP